MDAGAACSCGAGPESDTGSGKGLHSPAPPAATEQGTQPTRSPLAEGSPEPTLYEKRGAQRPTGLPRGGGGEADTWARAQLLTVRVGRVVVINAPQSSVVATQDDEVALVVGAAAEALLPDGQEAAVLHRAGAEVAQQQDGVDQHDGDVALREVLLDVPDGHRAAGEGKEETWVQEDLPRQEPRGREEPFGAKGDLEYSGPKRLTSGIVIYHLPISLLEGLWTA